MGKHASNLVRNSLVNLVYDSNMDVKKAAFILKIGYKAALKICNTFEKTGRIEKLKPKGPAKKYDEFKQRIIDFFTRNPDSTLNRCQEYLKSTNDEENESVPSLSTINRILASEKFTMKTLDLVPEQRNSELAIEKRANYVLKYMKLEELVNFVFIDEFGVNLSIRRRRGRSLIGTSAFIVLNGTRGRNLSVCAAIDLSGHLYHLATFSSFNQDLFIQFLANLKSKLDSSKRNLLICDNAAFHKTEKVKEFLKSNNLEMMFNAPWSPMLNPIEECFSKVKNFLKLNHSSNSPSLIANVASAFDTVTAEDCASWFRHSKQYFAQCLERKPINKEVESSQDDESCSEDELLMI